MTTRKTTPRMLAAEYTLQNLHEAAHEVLALEVQYKEAMARRNALIRESKVHKLTYQKIAKVTGLSVTSVKNIVYGPEPEGPVLLRS